jgi:hypothetical protein
VENFPTAEWRVGERFRSRYRFVVPTSIVPGDYGFGFSVHSSTPGSVPLTTEHGQPLVLQRLTVTGPERVMEPPSVIWRQEASFGDLGSLYGFNISGTEGGRLRLRAGEVFDINVVWKVEGSTSTSYKVFVHLADEHGLIKGQHDSEPGAGERPTSSWVPGEFVIDRHSLQVAPNTSPGQYQLLVGLYGPDGSRLTVHDSAGSPLPDALPLAGIEVEVVQ